MCIRDRRGIEQVKFIKSKPASVVADKDGNPVVHGVDTEGSVSYTHLRAHETVLDLVCRLLLEKKKQTHIKVISYTSTQNHKNDSITHLAAQDYNI